jgi:hypothetical protein
MIVFSGGLKGFSLLKGKSPHSTRFAGMRALSIFTMFHF